MCPERAPAADEYEGEMCPERGDAFELLTLGDEPYRGEPEADADSVACSCAKASGLACTLRYWFRRSWARRARSASTSADVVCGIGLEDLADVGAGRGDSM